MKKYKIRYRDLDKKANDNADTATSDYAIVESENVDKAIRSFRDYHDHVDIASIIEITPEDETIPDEYLHKILFDNVENPNLPPRRYFQNDALDIFYWKYTTAENILTDSLEYVHQVWNRLQDTIAPELTVSPVYSGDGMFANSFLVGRFNVLTQTTTACNLRVHGIGLTEYDSGEELAVKIARAILNKYMGVSARLK